jgi:hypothetical protein
MSVPFFMACPKGACCLSRAKARIIHAAFYFDLSLLSTGGYRLLAAPSKTMEHFCLELEYRGKKLELPAELLITGFIHKIFVTVGDVIIAYERDEENHYRAVVPPENVDKVDRVLLKLIAETIDTAFK